MRDAAMAPYAAAKYDVDVRVDGYDKAKQQNR